MKKHIQGTGISVENGKREIGVVAPTQALRENAGDLLFTIVNAVEANEKFASIMFQCDGAKHAKRSKHRKLLNDVMRFSSSIGEEMAGHEAWYFDIHTVAVACGATIGECMEVDKQAIEQLSEDMEQTREYIQNILNEVVTLNGHIQPKLTEMVKSVRAKRATITTELGKSLTLMKDVRKFFLDKDHETEIERLENFVTLAERMKALIEDGTVDAIVDIILRLEMGKGDTVHDRKEK